MAVKWVKEHRWAYHTVFWTSVITFIMIFEYVLTRSFMVHDDFGNINHELGISAWPIFITGTILGLIRPVLSVCIQTAGVFRHHDPGRPDTGVHLRSSPLIHHLPLLYRPSDHLVPGGSPVVVWHSRYCDALHRPVHRKSHKGMGAGEYE